MQKTEKLARVDKITDPGVPRRVSSPIAKASEDESKDENDVRWVQSNDRISKYMAGRADEGDPALASLEMEKVIEESRTDVADKRRQENERNDGVTDVVVLHELRRLLATRAIR